jgi:hypothetical protein
MAEMSNATRDDDPVNAAGQYPSIAMNRYHCEITQEWAGDADDDHSGVVGRQRIEESGTGPLPKESEYHPRNKHAFEESGTTTKYFGISEKNLVCDKESKEMALDDDGQDTTKKVGEVAKFVEYPSAKKSHKETGKNREESGKYSGITEKNLAAGDEERKEKAFDDDGRHPTKKGGKVVKYPSTKKSQEESGKNREEFGK